MRAVEGEAVDLTDDQLETLKNILLLDSTYFNQDSKGTKLGVGLRLWDDDGRCLEISYCVSKGNINLVALDADGHLIKVSNAVPGGFRNDKSHPIRPFTARLFPNDEALQHYAVGPDEAETSEATARITKTDVKTSTLVAEGSQLENLADGFTFLEGPAAAPNGDLYFVDFRENNILRWNVKTGKLATITEDSHATNGMQFDAKHRLIGCQGAMRRIVAFAPQSAKVLEVLTETYEGKRFNNPNDLWIDPRGGIYFTDPAYSRKQEELEQDGRHVYYITPGDKQVVKVADDFNTPNGIVGTPDGKTLYITDRRLGRTYRYTIQSDGTLSDKQLFCKVGADGMTLDEQGNLYTTPQAKEIRIFNPAGQQLPSIPLPAPASNVCFAGEEGTTLFITTANALYAIQMTVTGQ